MRFTGTAPSAWLVACVGMFVAAHGWAFALPPDTPVAKREAQTMRAVPEHNFQAINEENLKKLLGTASRYTGTQQEMVEFAAEAKQMFRDTDVYMRLVEFTLTDFAPPIAYATVIQFTLPADERGSDVGLANRKLGTTHFRSNSALLPEYEMCSYRQRFNFEGGSWPTICGLTKQLHQRPWLIDHHSLAQVSFAVLAVPSPASLTSRLTPGATTTAEQRFSDGC